MIANEIILRLIVAAVLCGTIGLEREYRHRPAGLRTNALVGLGTALFTIASIAFGQMDGSNVDISRVASTILTGIGFIGAGTIIHARGTVIGLTTAATIWVVAAIGMLAGMGLYAAAVLGWVIAMIILVVFKNIKIEEESHTRKE